MLPCDHPGQNPTIDPLGRSRGDDPGVVDPPQHPTPKSGRHRQENDLFGQIRAPPALLLDRGGERLAEHRPEVAPESSPPRELHLVNQPRKRLAVRPQPHDPPPRRTTPRAMGAPLPLGLVRPHGLPASTAIRRFVVGAPPDLVQPLLQDGAADIQPDALGLEEHRANGAQEPTPPVYAELRA